MATGPGGRRRAPGDAAGPRVASAPADVPEREVGFEHDLAFEISLSPEVATIERSPSFRPADSSPPTGAPFVGLTASANRSGAPRTTVSCQLGASGTRLTQYPNPSAAPCRHGSSMAHVTVEFSATFSRAASTAPRSAPPLETTGERERGESGGG